MSTLTKRSIAATAAILIVPSLVVGVIAAHPSKPARLPPAVTASPTTNAVTVTAQLKPHRNIAFTTQLDPSVAPPATTCQSAMSAMQASGGSPAFVGRLEIEVRPTRALQLRVDKISILTVRREDVSLTAVAGCAGSAAPTPFPGHDGFTETFSFAPGELRFRVPAVRLADQLADTVPPIVVPLEGNGPLDGVTFDLRPGSTGKIPVYVLTSGGPPFRTGFQIAVDLTVNGLAHHQVVTNAGEPFWIYEANFRQGDGPILLWMENSRTWRTS